MMNEIGYLIQANDEAKQAYQYPVSRDYLIGSSTECNLKIADEDILGLHCRIRLVNDEVCIFSLSSQNPVFLNEEPVSEEGKTLQDKDKIRINDHHKFEWKIITDRRICSRSLPLENEPSLEVNARYSDSAFIAWKNVDRIPEECEDVALRNSPIEQNDELVSEEETLSKMDFVEKSNLTVGCEINRSSVDVENKTNSSMSTPVKSQKLKNPVSFASNSKNNLSKISHYNDNDKTKLECSARNIPEDMFEDLIMHQPSSQKPFHSTPKAMSELKNRKIALSSSSSLVDVNFEKDVEIYTPELTPNCDIAEKTDAGSEKSTCSEAKKLNSASKKCTITPTKRASLGITESRRNTRGRTSLLRKTFEENSCDNEVKSLTTPEKLTEAINITQTSFLVDSETENVADTNAEYKSLNESSKTGFISVSDENDTCETSFIDKYKMCNVVKNVSISKPGLVAKCARNLSYISPPENNRSQEYMDSMVTTPQKNSSSMRESITENFNVSTPSFLSNMKDSSFDESMNSSLSSARKRRSTGFTPFVGTPSNEYRVTRKMSTPFSKSVLSRTSVDFEGLSRDSKQSFERRSTPYKLPSRKSSMRDSISCQPTIQESTSFEELEAGNHEYDSINDPKFRFITKRRKQRYGENTFAEEDRILEESELKSDCSGLDNDCSLEEENTVASVTNVSISSEDCDELSNNDRTETESVKNAIELKSILTPLPKSLALKEKSAKRVTFVLPNSPECTMNKEDSTLSVDESFAMISSSKTTHNDEQSFNYDSVISDEELHASDRQETDLSCNTLSEPEASSVTNSITEKYDGSLLDVSDGQCQTKIQSNLNDLSGVEQIQSPEPSPTKHNMSATDNISETDVETNSSNETPQHSSVHVTDVESSLVSLEPSNRSNFGEEECTETSIEVESLKEITKMTVNKSINESDSAKISCSPGINLSGVKSLFNTPDKSRPSSVSKTAKLKCILNFKPKLNSKTNTNNDTKMKSASARKSAVELTNKSALVPSSRMCKSLNMNEIFSKSKSLLVEKIESEPSKVTTVVHDKEISIENASNEDSISTKQMTETESTNERCVANNKIPEIVVTEATFIDESINNEGIELSNKTEEEVVERSKLELPNKVQFDDKESKSETSNHKEKEYDQGSNAASPNKVQLDDDESKLETSDYEEELNLDHDEILSSEGSITDDAASPVMTQIRRSAISEIQLDPKNPSSEGKTELVEPKSFTAISLSENEREKDQDLEASCNTFSVDMLLENKTLPTNERTEETENESQLSLEVMVSDRDNSRLCDALSPENTDDINSSKTSGCNDSQTYDLSAKDTSDFDTSKTSVNESSCNNSELFDLSVTDSIECDTSKNIAVTIDVDNSPMGNMLFTEPHQTELSENNVNRKNKIVECLSAETEMQNNTFENAQKLDEIEDILDTNFVNVSRSTTSSQEMGIRIDASSGLINDLHKELESTPHPSNPSSSEATPAEFFKPVSFPESSNTSRIECEAPNQPENYNKPNSPLNEINDVIFTPIKTVLRGSSTPQSTIRRCRKSLRIHKCNPNDVTNKSHTSVHDCSILSNDSQKQDDAEKVENPREIYKQVVDELNIKLVSVKEKVDALQESLKIEENTTDEVNKSVPCSESIQLIESVSPVISSTQSPIKETTISTNAHDSLPTNGEQLEHPSENVTEKNTCADPKELSDVHELTVNISRSLTADENREQLKIVSTSTVSNESVENVSTALQENKNVDSEKNNDLFIETIPDKRRGLRTRKEQSVAPVVDTSKQGTVTRTRQRDRQTLWYKKHFHCYLCFNSPAVLNKKCVRKTKIRQLEEDLNEALDDKENVCSLLKVMDKPKKIEQPNEQITAAMPPVTEKKTRKPRRLKNVENIAAETESQQDIEVVNKRSCSIVLTPLDPEVIKSPVKVDKSDNISPVKEPPVATKKKRVTRTANKTEQKPAPTISRTRQKQVKAVTFDIATRKSEEVTQQTEEKYVQIEAAASKRNLRSKVSIVKPAASKKMKVTDDKVEPNEAEKSYEISRTIKIHLEPVNDDIASPPVDKRTRAKRGVAATKNAQKPEETNEKSTKTTRAAKRAPENVEEIVAELPKRRRVKAKVADEIPSKANTKSENNKELVKELPKRTRAQVKTNVQVEAKSSANSLGRSTRATKTKPLENLASDSGIGTKKRVRDVVESSTPNDTEKSNKKTKIVKSVEISEPPKSAKSTAAKKPVEKFNSAKGISTHSISIEEPVASSSKKIPTPRMTRSRKTEIIQTKKNTPIKNATKETRVTKKKTVAASEPHPTVDEDSSVNSRRIQNVKKSSPTEKVVTKRTVVTRTKTLSVQKGRISSTLKTSSRGSLVVRKSMSKSSSAKNTSQEKPVTSNLRSTRRRPN